MGNLRVRNFLDQPLRRVGQRELNAIAERNARYRSSRIGGQRAVLTFCDLRELDFTGMDLSGADLSGSNLSGATLLRAAFVDATLFIAEIKGTKLRDCNMMGSDMRGVCLRGSDLSYVRMKGADLRGAVVAHYDDTGDIEVRTRDVVTAELARSRLNGADLRDVRLPSSLCIQSDMEDADLRGVDLNGASLRMANMRGADLDGADLSRADLSGANLRGAILTNVDISGANFDGCDIADAVLDEAAMAVLRPRANTIVYDYERFDRLLGLLQLHGEWLSSKGGQGKRLELNDAIVRGVDLSTFDLSGGVFKNCRFENVQFNQVKCFVSRFTDCKFLGCEFRDADLRGSNLDKSRFKDCRFEKVDFGSIRNKAGQHAISNGKDVISVCSFKDAAFVDCSLKKIEMPDINGRSLQFRNSDLIGINVLCANLEDSRFIGCKLDTVDLDQASHKGIEFFW